jgi:hypothetical protein
MKKIEKLDLAKPDLKRDKMVRFEAIKPFPGMERF